MWKISRSFFTGVRWPQLIFALLLETLKIMVIVFGVVLLLKSILSGANVNSSSIFKLGFILLATFFLAEGVRFYFKIDYPNERIKNTRWFWLAGTSWAFMIFVLDLWGTGWKKAVFFSLFSLLIIYIVKKLFTDSTLQK